MIAQTDAFQECRRPDILRRLFLRSGILCGPDLCLCPCLLLLAPDLCPVILPGPNLHPRISHVPDQPVLLHGLNLCSGILCGVYLNWIRLGTLYRLCLGILYGLFGLHRPGLRPCILAGRPRLELT